MEKIKRKSIVVTAGAAEDTYTCGVRGPWPRSISACGNFVTICSVLYGLLEPHLHTLAALIAAHPDRTLAERKDALATPASVLTVWRAVRALGLTVKKNGPPVRTRSA